MIPDKVKIEGHTYTVSLKQNLCRDHEAKGMSCNNGLWIEIDEGLPQQNQQSTFLHELGEQICAINDIHLEHQTLTTVFRVLYQVLHDNKLYFGDD